MSDVVNIPNKERDDAVVIYSSIVHSRQWRRDISKKMTDAWFTDQPT